MYPIAITGGPHQNSSEFNVGRGGGGHREKVCCHDCAIFIFEIKTTQSGQHTFSLWGDSGPSIARLALPHVFTHPVSHQRCRTLVIQ